MVDRVEDGTPIPGESQGNVANPVEREQLYEERARALGWKPETEFSGDPADWRPAKEFLDRQPLFDKIHSLKNELFHQKKAFEADLGVIKEYVKQMSQIEYDKALRDIKTQRRIAVAEGNVEAVDAYDNQIEQLQVARKPIKEAPVQQEGPSPEYQEWIQRNSWYTTDKELHDAAETLGTGFYARNQGKVTNQQVLDYVEQNIKRMYPDKFQSKPRQTVAAVESGGPSSGGNSSSSTKLRESDLDPQERQVMQTLVARKVVTKAEYLEQLAKAKARG